MGDAPGVSSQQYLGLVLLRTSRYLLSPIVVQSAGHYFITVSRSLNSLATIRYVEIGTESSKILEDSDA